MIKIEAYQHLKDTALSQQRGNRSIYLEITAPGENKLTQHIKGLVQKLDQLCNTLKIDQVKPRYRHGVLKTKRIKKKGQWIVHLKNIHEALLDITIKLQKFENRDQIKDTNKRMRTRVMWTEGEIEMLNSVTMTVVKALEKAGHIEASTEFQEHNIIAVNVFSNDIPRDYVKNHHQTERAPARINIPGVPKCHYNDNDDPQNYKKIIDTINQSQDLVHIY
tara:strand:+ start:984 stop:1643 length:660 start_codon:yes stop_codon:yes gene_type:complete